MAIVRRICSNWFLILTIVILTYGAFVRFVPTTFMTLSEDDVAHLAYSGVRFDPTEGLRLSGYNRVFRRSFTDAHPPMRNMIMRFVFPLAKYWYQIRLPFVIGGILFMLSTLYLCQSLGFSKQVGVLLLVLLSSAKLPIILSIETRGYIFMMTALFCGISFLLRYVKHKSDSEFMLYALFSVVAVSFEYCAIFPISVFSILVFSNRRFSVKKLKGSSKSLSNIFHQMLGGMGDVTLKTKAFSMTLAVLCMCTVAFLFFEFYHNAYLVKFERYSRYFSSDVADLALNEVLRRYLQFFLLLTDEFLFFAKSGFSQLVKFLFVTGLFLSAMKRQWLLLIACSAIFVLALYLDFIGLYPFAPRRQSIYLLLPILIMIGSGIDIILNHVRGQNMQRGLFLLFMAIFVVAGHARGVISPSYVSAYFNAKHPHETMSVEDLSDLVRFTSTAELKSAHIAHIRNDGGVLKKIHTSTPKNLPGIMHNALMYSYINGLHCETNADKCRTSRDVYSVMKDSVVHMFAYVKHDEFTTDLLGAGAYSSVQEMANSSKELAVLLDDMRQYGSFWFFDPQKYDVRDVSRFANPQSFEFGGQEYVLHFFPEHQLFFFEVLS